MITIWTIGHSTRTAEKFGEILLAQEIKVLVDVRSFPGSRRLPQFNKAELAEALGALGIEYRHEPRLGGASGWPPSKKSPARNRPPMTRS